MKFKGRTNEYIELAHITKERAHEMNEVLENGLSALWFKSDDNVLKIDGVEYTFHNNQIVFLTEFHQVETLSTCNIHFLRFNRDFFCILDHDSEVGCRGILFFGASQVPIIRIPEKEIPMMELFWDTFMNEMGNHDSYQIDMLQMMLKRYLILCTRYYKEQCHVEKKEDAHHDVIREFNFLVEQHFRSKHSVKEYADLMHRSPKTLSNIFSKVNQKTPLQYIQERRMLEARRSLRYTDKAISEIAYDIGFDDVQSFSRFFKKKEGVSPTGYRDNG